MLLRNILIPLLAAALLSPPSHAAAKPRIPLCLQLVVLAGLTAAMRAEALSEEPIPVHHEAAGHLLGPVAVAWNAYGRTAEDTPLAQAIAKTILKDYGLILGYLTLQAGLLASYERLGKIDFEEFLERTKKRMKPGPERVLYLTSFEEKDRTGHFADFFFTHHYGQAPQNDFRKFRTRGQLRQILESFEAEIAQHPERAFDRVEVFMHGNPGILGQGNGTTLNAHKLKDYFGERKFKITRAGAEVRFISCNLAGWRRGTGYDTSMVEFLASMLLPEGGRAFAATRQINIDTRDFADYTLPNYPPRQEGGRAFVINLDQLFFTGVAPALLLGLNLGALYKSGFRLPPAFIELDIAAAR
ncbi:hypothetical protein K2X33_01205 [bacterium]|nr:hypothetical protein [bacterium]